MHYCSWIFGALLSGLAIVLTKELWGLWGLVVALPVIFGVRQFEASRIDRQNGRAAPRGSPSV